VKPTHLVQLLVPLADSRGKRFPESLYRQLTEELTGRFGGLTAYARAPASGLWKKRPGKTARDDIVVYEVMVERLEVAWWRKYRKTLEVRFAQDELVIRAQEIRRL
jgi:hypothetical protein